MRPTKLTVRMVCERLCEGWRAFREARREARIFSLPGYTLRYCRRCGGWGAEPSGAACFLCGGQGWRAKK